MPPPARLIPGRFSALIALVACLSLLFLSSIFTNRDISVNSKAVFGDKDAVPVALVRREVEAPLTKVAVPFGNKAAPDLSYPKGNSLLQSSRVKRDDVTLTWDAAKAQGLIQLARLTGPRTESINNNLNQMQSPDGTPDGTGNGWTVQEFQDESETPGGYQPAFEDLDISLGADNHYRYCSQNLKFSNCNFNDLNPTSGLFISYINILSSTMVAYSSYSPAYRIDKTDPAWKTKLPRVSRMSDVLWIQWLAVAEQQGTPEKVSQLKYIFRYDVITANTKFIIEQAAALEEGEPIEEGEFEAEWPGYEFAMGDDRFTALLGTVHGISIVDLLVTHANELGSKTIESVTIFTTEGDIESGEIYHMLWTLTS